MFDADRSWAEALRAACAPGGEVTGDAAALCRTVGPGGLVVVATTHDALAELGEVAVAHGCHVLVEKPGGRRPDELRRLAAAADARGLVVRIGFNHRFHPSMLKVRRMVASGEFGELLLIRGTLRPRRTAWLRARMASRCQPIGRRRAARPRRAPDRPGPRVGGRVELRYAALDTMFWPMPVEDNAFLHLSVGEQVTLGCTRHGRSGTTYSRSR